MQILLTVGTGMHGNFCQCKYIERCSFFSYITLFLMNDAKVNNTGNVKFKCVLKLERKSIKFMYPAHSVPRTTKTTFR